MNARILIYARQFVNDCKGAAATVEIIGTELEIYGTTRVGGPQTCFTGIGW